MKPNNNTWWIFLLSCITLTACENNGELLDANDTVDSDLVEVKLALSTGGVGNASTRMTAENTQGDNIDNNTYTYRGISQVNFVPFSSTTTGDSPVSPSSTRLQTYNVYAGYNHSYQDAIANHQENRVYTTTMVSSGTNSFLVYAWPEGGGADAAAADKFAYGSLIPIGLDEDPAITLNTSGITFKPDKVWDDNETRFPYFKNMANAVASYLTRVAIKEVDGEPLYAKSGELGIMFSNLSHDGLPFQYDRAFIQQRLSDLRGYSSVLKTEIEKNNDYYKLNTNGTWKDLSDLVVFPYGTFLFKWEDGEKRFVVLDYEGSKTVINPPIADYHIFAYPPQLWYYANTAIHTSSEDLLSSVFNNAWNTVLSDSRFEANGVISSETKVVAVDKTMEYAVGRMATKIHVGTSNNKLPGLSDINLLQLKGVMVTNQYKVGYDFQPLETNNTESADEPYYILYDRDVKTKNDKGATTPIIPPGNAKWSAANHTLVFPSIAGEKIYIIAEMFYNGDISKDAPPLTGYNGYPILPQSYFYLVGELDPKLDANNQPLQTFESDKVTEVFASIMNFNGAYNYVPDLNSPSLVLSLKLELKWEQTEPNSVWLH